MIHAVTVAVVVIAASTTATVVVVAPTVLAVALVCARVVAVVFGDVAHMGWEWLSCWWLWWGQRFYWRCG